MKHAYASSYGICDFVVVAIREKNIETRLAQHEKVPIEFFCCFETIKGVISKQMNKLKKERLL